MNSIQPRLFRRATLEQIAQIGFRDGRGRLDGTSVALPGAGSLTRVTQPYCYVEETVAGVHVQLLGVFKRHHLFQSMNYSSAHENNQ